MNSTNFWKLLGALGLSFGAPWLFLVVLPYLGQSDAKTVSYGEGEEVEGGLAVYPDPTLQRHGASDYGRDIYAAEGCAYCHTQVVRPTYAGSDMWHSGWGGREEAGLARETQPADYATEGVALLGYQRIGQDLSNIGHRVSSREEMHRHLFDPKSFDYESAMPAFKHLYRPAAVGTGFVPTPRAEALVDYLFSLKKDQPLPKAYLSGN